MHFFLLDHALLNSNLWDPPTHGPTFFEFKYWDPQNWTLHFEFKIWWVTLPRTHSSDPTSFLLGGSQVRQHRNNFIHSFDHAFLLAAPSSPSAAITHHCTQLTCPTPISSTIQYRGSGQFVALRQGFYKCPFTTVTTLIFTPPYLRIHLILSVFFHTPK